MRGKAEAALRSILAPPQSTPPLQGEGAGRVSAALISPDQNVLERGANVMPGSPAEFGKFIAEETEKWAKVIGAANLKAE